MSYRKKHISPRLKKLRPKKKFYKKPGFWIIVALLTIFSTLHIMLFLQSFQVENFEISGNERVKAQDIENASLGSINKTILAAGIFNVSSKSIFIIDSQKLKEHLQGTFADIESVQIKKELPNSLIIKVKERQPVAIFCQRNDSCFYIDENGVIFELLKNSPQDIIRITSDQKEVLVGENAISKNTMDTINKVKKNLKDNFQIDVKSVFVSNTLVFKTAENWQIYFDPNSDINLQIIKMNSLLKNEITPNERKNLQYIYLQYQDRAYYR